MRAHIADHICNHTHVLAVPLPQTILLGGPGSFHFVTHCSDTDLDVHRAQHADRFAAVFTYQPSDHMSRELAVELAARNGLQLCLCSN